MEEMAFELPEEAVLELSMATMQCDAGGGVIK